MSLQSFLHVRRCHVCGATCEREGAHVESCTSCGKRLARFYYFDDLRAPIYSETEPRPESDASAADPQELLMPVRGRAQEPSAEQRKLKGFTAIW